MRIFEHVNAMAPALWYKDAKPTLLKLLPTYLYIWESALPFLPKQLTEKFHVVVCLDRDPNLPQSHCFPGTV